MTQNATSNDLVDLAKEQVIRKAAWITEWLDTLWSTYMPHRSGSQHMYTPTELKQRLVLFGLWMGLWMVVLGAVSVLAVLKRQHGSIAEAIEFVRSARRRDLIQIVIEGKQYNEIATESDEEMGVDVTQMNSLWCCSDSILQGPEDEEQPPVLRIVEVSEEDRERDRRKLEAKLEQLEQYGDEDEENLRGSQAEQEIAELKKIGQTRQKVRVDEINDAFQNSKELLQIQEQLLQTSERSLLQQVKVPVSIMLFLGYIVMCAGMPLLAAGHASCNQGLPWEFHLPFFYFFILVKCWEVILLAFDTSMPGKIGLRWFLLKFCFSFLAFLDGYSDCMSIVIAHDCGSALWHWMALSFVIGVVLLQWVLMGFLSLLLDSSNTCFFKMLHMDALAECCAMKPTEAHALTIWKMVNVARFLFEDLPQSVLQVLFIVNVKKNYVMICSVVVGVITSAKAIVDAGRRAAAAVGTNFEYLKAASDMQTGLEKKDAKVFFEAYDVAEKSGANLDMLLERAEEAERVFEFKAAALVHRIEAQAQETVPPANLLQNAQAASKEDSYVRRRRTMQFAQRAAKRRQRELTSLEGPDSGAVKAGVHSEGRHSWRTYVSRRRTVEFAVQSQEEREKRLLALVREGTGCCWGSRPKKPGEMADATADPLLCSTALLSHEARLFPLKQT
mmetsp:Transcript_88021/g.156082  ORF Transcript_88021/g.156082 Transcript_88021/m.156082 type:complete len:671 (+) Transcript_88021:1-2013(+)